MQEFKITIKESDSGLFRYRHHIDNKRVTIDAFYNAALPEYAKNFREVSKRKNGAKFTYQTWEQ